MLPLCLALAAASPTADTFVPLGPGVEYARLQVSGRRAAAELHVVRFDPARVEVALLARNAAGGPSRTAADWCDRSRCIAAINAGMYEVDQRSHVGYLAAPDHRGTARWNEYQSIFLFAPSDQSDSAALVADRNAPGFEGLAKRYRGAAQNLRLIERPGRSVWKPSARRWSEAAIAMDDQGRILWLFCREGLSMAEFNKLLLGLPLGVVAAQHVEGGPEASLSIRSERVRLDLAGSYETGFWPHRDNRRQWDLPNVLVIKSK